MTHGLIPQQAFSRLHRRGQPPEIHVVEAPSDEELREYLVHKWVFSMLHHLFKED